MIQLALYNAPNLYEIFSILEIYLNYICDHQYIRHIVCHLNI